MHMFRTVFGKQAGFTLIELLLATAITGLISGGIVRTVMQTSEVSTLDRRIITSVKEIEKAVDSISRDALGAQIVNDGYATYGTPDDFPLHLYWKKSARDIDETVVTTEHDIYYHVTAGELTRQDITTVTENGFLPVSTEVTTSVADGITEANFEFTELSADYVLDFRLTATVTEGSKSKSVTRECQITLRSSKS